MPRQIRQDRDRVFHHRSECSWLGYRCGWMDPRWNMHSCQSLSIGSYPRTRRDPFIKLWRRLWRLFHLISQVPAYGGTRQNYNGFRADLSGHFCCQRNGSNKRVLRWIDILYSWRQKTFDMTITKCRSRPTFDQTGMHRTGKTWWVFRRDIAYNSFLYFSPDQRKPLPLNYLYPWDCEFPKDFSGNHSEQMLWQSFPCWGTAHFGHRLGCTSPAFFGGHLGDSAAGSTFDHRCWLKLANWASTSRITSGRWALNRC